jgi:hypothetical protein
MANKIHNGDRHRMPGGVPADTIATGGPPPKPGRFLNSVGLKNENFINPAYIFYNPACGCRGKSFFIRREPAGHQIGWNAL